MKPREGDAYHLNDPACPARSVRRQSLRRFRSPLLGAATGVFGRFFGTLSWRRAQGAGTRLGALAGRLSRREGRRMDDHLALAFPELEPGRRAELVRGCWRHLGTCLGEMLHLSRRPAAEASRWVEVEGFERVEAERRAGRVVLVLTGHCGNWELISAANHSHGLDLVAMARNHEDPNLARAIVDLRRHLGTTTIGRGAPGSSRQLLRTLRRGGALAMLIDQDIAAEGVWVPFFGRLAYTPTAAADIAQRLGAAVVPTFAERLADGSHRVTFHAPLELSADRFEATAVMTLAIEEQIRRCPEQWVWMHRRWRRRPPDEVGR